MSSLEIYCTQILDGKITACNKIKKISEKLLDKLHFPGEYHYDADIADRHIKFIETFCKTPSGKIGTPLRLQLFQKARFEAAFGFVDDNDLRQYNEVLIIEGRKNGKTTECASVELDQLVNTDEGAPQIYNVATQKDQANLGFDAVVKMRRQSPMLSKHLKKRAYDIYNPKNMGFIKALASNTNSLDGLDTQMVTIDELGAIKNRDLYDLMKQSMSARRQPLLFTISTNGFVRNGIFDAQYAYAANILDGKITDEKFLPFIYELDSYEEWTDESCWIKANPGLGTIKSYEFLRGCVEKAKVDDTFRPTVLVKDFNLIQNSSNAWLSYDKLNNETVVDFAEMKFRYCIGGFDAADSVDLNAAKAICKRPGDDHFYVKQMYWIPQRKIDEMKGRRHPDDAPYDIWAANGLIRVTEGNKVNKRVFLDWFCELRDKEDIYPMFIGYDPWHVDDSLLLAFEQEFGKTTMVPVRQGVATLSQPMIDLAAEFEAKRIIYNNNPIDKWCLANTYAKRDSNGNIQPDKGSVQRKRIDGTAALLDAYVVYCDNRENYETLI